MSYLRPNLARVAYYALLIILLFRTSEGLAYTPEVFRLQNRTLTTSKEFHIIKDCEIKQYYTIGKVDPRFDISPKEYEALVHKAVNEWNSAAGKTLLIYSPKKTPEAATYSMKYSDSHEKVARLYNNNVLLSVIQNSTKIDNSIKLGSYIETKQSNRTIKQVNIYAYATSNDLYATILHETGHLLGIEHTSDPHSVMAAQTKDLLKQPTVLTNTDLDALKNICTP